MTEWRTMALRLAERYLWRPAAPLFVRDLGWKLIDFAARGATSNPVSYALRPLVAHPKLRLGVGMTLALLVITVAVSDSGPVLAAPNTGGPTTLVIGISEPALKTVTAIRKPLDSYTVTQGFWLLHSGIDLATPVGTPVFAIMKGKVLRADQDWAGYGKLVVIEHENGYQSWYAHLSTFLVKVGDEVTTDTQIAGSGNTGHSTGPHLHLEIREDGRPINPAPILGIKI